MQIESCLSAANFQAMPWRAYIDDGREEMSFVLGNEREIGYIQGRDICNTGEIGNIADGCV